jgi:hypothetical protein
VAVDTTHVILRGDLQTLGGAAAAGTTVKVYWGTSDPGMTASGWDGGTYTFAAPQDVGEKTHQVAVPAGNIGYYRYYVENTSGYSWWSRPAMAFVPTGDYSEGLNMDFEDAGEDFIYAPAWYGLQTTDGGWRKSAENGVTPHSGSYMYQPWHGNGNFCDEYQNVSLPHLAGVTGNFVFRGYYNRPATSPDGVIHTIYIQFKDAAGTVLATYSSTAINLDTDPNTWEEFSFNGPIPAGMATALIHLKWGRASGAGDVAGYWDDLSLVFSVLGGTKLTMIKAGTGNYTTLSPAEGDTWYNSGTVVSMTAVAQSGSVFTGWSGAGLSGNASPQDLLMNADKTVTATFDLTAGPPGVMTVIKFK